MYETFHVNNKLENNDINSENLFDKSKTIRNAIKIIIISFFTTALVVSSYGFANRKKLFESDDKDIVDFSLIRRGYSRLPYFEVDSSSFLKYSFLDGYTAVIEPYSLMDLDLYDDNDDNYYSYTVCSLSDSGDCYKGDYHPSDSSLNNGITVECNPFDKYSISVLQMSVSNGDLKNEITGQAICMYVRREIRSLTPEDLSSTMDAMHMLWKLSETEGKELYGPTFLNSDNLLEMHYFGASWRDADHIHEGMGFLPTHIELSNIFESAVQLVNPSFALPYWDFTIESSQGIDLWDSPVFTADTFGSIPEGKTWKYSEHSLYDGVIPDGRWANTSVSLNTKFEDLKTSFGYLRAPWSLNPTPYVTRFPVPSDYVSFPKCSYHYNALSFTTLQSFLTDAPDKPHGPLHTMIGGVFGCDLLDPLIDAGIITEDNEVSICRSWITTMKETYRQHYITPLSSCTLDDLSLTPDNQNCGFQCGTSTKEVSDFNKKFGVIFGDLSDEQYVILHDFICGGKAASIVVGDHLESASAGDPSFWPIHPTSERLLQAKYMAGGFEDNEWSNEPSDVCSRYPCYDISTGISGNYESCCDGHYSYSQMFDWKNADRNSFVGSTNEEILTATNPTLPTYSMPYIYDGFEWDHCVSTGSDINNLLETLSKTQSSII